MNPAVRPATLAVSAALALPISVALAQDAPPVSTREQATEQALLGRDIARTLDRVVVTATRGSKAIDKIPGAVSVVTRREMDAQLLVSEDLSQVLATQVAMVATYLPALRSGGRD